MLLKTILIWSLNKEFCGKLFPDFFTKTTQSFILILQPHSEIELWPLRETVHPIPDKNFVVVKCHARPVHVRGE
jgi:hypothetical protein